MRLTFLITPPLKFAGKIETVTIDLKPQDKASADAADAARKIDAANVVRRE